MPAVDRVKNVRRFCCWVYGFMIDSIKTFCFGDDDAKERYSPIPTLSWMPLPASASDEDVAVARAYHAAAVWEAGRALLVFGGVGSGGWGGPCLSSPPPSLPSPARLPPASTAPSASGPHRTAAAAR